MNADDSPISWMRRRQAQRAAAHLEAVRHRGLSRLERLGPDWHFVDVPAADGRVAELIAIGPGGVHAVHVADHGRDRVLLSQDIVHIKGRHLPYVTEARTGAQRIGRVLSDAAGVPVPVVPVLVLVGSGVITVHGLPKKCLVTTDRELDRLLITGGTRVKPDTVDKLIVLARHLFRG